MEDWIYACGVIVGKCGALRSLCLKNTIDGAAVQSLTVSLGRGRTRTTKTADLGRLPVGMQRDDVLRSRGAEGEAGQLTR